MLSATIKGSIVLLGAVEGCRAFSLAPTSVFSGRAAVPSLHEGASLGPPHGRVGTALLPSQRRASVALGISIDRHHNFGGISQGKVDALFDKIDRMDLDLSDVEEKFVRGSGAGGQKINKTSSNVQMTHAPSGIKVNCQRERERSKNRFIALRLLVEKVEFQHSGGKEKADTALAKKKKNKARAKRRRTKKAAAASDSEGEGGQESEGEEGDDAGGEGPVVTGGAGEAL